MSAHQWKFCFEADLARAPSPPSFKAVLSSSHASSDAQCEKILLYTFLVAAAALSVPIFATSTGARIPARRSCGRGVSARARRRSVHAVAAPRDAASRARTSPCLNEGPSRTRFERRRSQRRGLCSDGSSRLRCASQRMCSPPSWSSRRASASTGPQWAPSRAKCVCRRVTCAPAPSNPHFTRAGSSPLRASRRTSMCARTKTACVLPRMRVTAVCSASARVERGSYAHNWSRTR
eukprot:3864623-Pleurochrysis_carterae.AAC.1